ncbi:HNH endonuclease signature motif containing protein [Williamsia phyllosphaerae]|nr:HNH endonuclease signature motif containing protein [Williamsia phyllosphaerae]
MPMPTASPVLDLLATLDETLDEVNAADLSRLDESQLRTLLHGVERVARKAAVASHTTITEISDRGSHTRWGYKRVAQMVVGELKISASDAARRLRVAAATVCMRSFTGEMQEPKHFDLSQAVFDAELSERHADEILKVLEKIPDAVSAEKRERAQRVMTESARDLDPRQIEAVGDRLLAHLDPDGTLTDDADRAKRRGLSLSRQDASMMSKLKGELDPATRAMFDVLFDAWARPGMNNPEDPESPSGSYSDPDTDRDLADAAAQRDTRSAPQRRHDALSAMAAWFIANGTLGSHRGAPAQVVVTMTYEQVMEMAGVATTMSGGLIPVVDALELAKANNLLLAVLDAQGLPMFLGRSRRLASAAQRIAMWINALGCTFGGCTAPFTWTEAHHVTDWSKGGLTDINQLTPACPDHHSMVGDGPEQWQTVIVEHGRYKGRCAWIPPASIDPERQPRINHAHHPEELLEQAWERARTAEDPDRSDPWGG